MPIPLIALGAGAASALFATGCLDDAASKRKLVSKAQAALAIAPENACRDGFVYIPAGPFEMSAELYGGQPGGFGDETPTRIISTDAYCIARSETTNAQYNALAAMQKTASQDTRYYDGGEKFNGDNKPVINVSWEEANVYCKSIGGRLPTEAEWEKAARGPQQFVYVVNNDELKEKEANYGRFSGETKEVCSYTVNGYGLCDMLGNVYEWTNDWYAPGAYKSMESLNPQGPDYGYYKVLRGGSWSDNADSLRAANRDLGDPDCRLDSIGFCCVVAPQDSK